MNYVVFDLETNGRNYFAPYPTEILQIGAIKLDNKLQTLGTFSGHIRPKFKITRFILNFLDVNKEVFEDSKEFSEVIKHFIKFCGNHFVLVSFGINDFYSLFMDSKMNNVNTNWMKNLLDIQPYFQHGVEQSLKDIGYSFEGKMHNALDDAINTSKLFKENYDKIDTNKFENIDKKRILIKRLSKFTSRIQSQYINNGEILTWNNYLEISQVKQFISNMGLTKTEIKELENMFIRNQNHVLARYVKNNNPVF